MSTYHNKPVQTLRREYKDFYGHDTFLTDEEIDTALRARWDVPAYSYPSFLEAVRTADMVKREVTWIGATT